MKFSIGYNYDSRIVALLEKYRNNIEAFYLPIPQRYASSGRNRREPPDYVKQVPGLIKTCRTFGIASQLLLNATCEGKNGLNKYNFRRIVNYIKQLKEKGLSSVVVTNPIYISAIRREMRDITIESSVNCYVKTFEHALYLRDLGVNVLTVDRDINRDIAQIKEIKSRTGLKIRLMLNEGCLNHCPYRISHYNYIAHGPLSKKLSIDGIFLDAFCIATYAQNPLKIFRIPFVPPDAVRYYGQCADYYKLSTRVFTVERIETCLKAYIKGKFSGNVLDLLDCPGLSFFEYVDYDVLRRKNFFKKMLRCTLQCNRCNYCKDVFNKAVLVNRRYLAEENKEHQKKTIGIYTSALKNNLGNDTKIQAHINMGKAYCKLHNYREAIKSMRHALRFRYQGFGGYSLFDAYNKKQESNERILRAQCYALLSFCYRRIKESGESAP